MNSDFIFILNHICYSDYLHSSAYLQLLSDILICETKLTAEESLAVVAPAARAVAL